MPEPGFSESPSSTQRSLADDLPRLHSLVCEALTCANPDGFLTVARMKEQLLKKDTSADQALVLFSLITHCDDLKELSDDEPGADRQLHKEDVAAVLNSLKRNQKLSPYLQSNYKQDWPFQWNVECHWRLLNQSSLYLYSDRVTPLSSITPEACRQATGVGNCHFVAAMTSTATTKPHAIFSMIKERQDGRYDVTFPGLKPVTIDGPGAGELLWYGLCSHHGIWPAVLQKAYGQLCDPKTKYPIEGAGGSPFQHGLRTMTGGQVNEDSNWATRYSTSHSRMQKAFAEARPVTAGINGEFLHLFGLSDNRENYSRLSGSHTYAVIGFQPNSARPEEAVIMIQNPSAVSSWAPELGVKVPEGVTDLGSGKFSMNLRSFHKIFSSAEYAEHSPPGDTTAKPATFHAGSKPEILPARKKRI